MTEQQPTTDPEAPEPRRPISDVPPSGTGQRSIRRPGASSRRRSAGPRRTSRAPTAVPEGMTPEDALRGLLQMPAAALIVTGKRVGSVPLVADGATILVHGPEVTRAIAEIAEHDPRVMALLEKVITFGPYGGLVTALFMMGAQFARNHGGPPELLDAMGASPPEKIIAAGGIDLTIVPVPEPSRDGNHADATV